MSAATGKKTEREGVFYPKFREELADWVRNDRKTAFRVLELVEAVLADPFSGIGKPEPLRHELAGCRSRRITQEHRLIYQVTESRVYFLQARYLYE
jgi:toxin YoeB